MHIKVINRLPLVIFTIVKRIRSKGKIKVILNSIRMLNKKILVLAKVVINLTNDRI